MFTRIKENMAEVYSKASQIQNFIKSEPPKYANSCWHNSLPCHQCPLCHIFSPFQSQVAVMATAGHVAESAIGCHDGDNCSHMLFSKYIALYCTQQPGVCSGISRKAFSALRMLSSMNRFLNFMCHRKWWKKPTRIQILKVGQPLCGDLN